jgi:hypothetical protein
MVSALVPWCPSRTGERAALHRGGAQLEGGVAELESRQMRKAVGELRQGEE